MNSRLALVLAASTALCLLHACTGPTLDQKLPDLTPLFNGVDFEGWKVDDVAATHWRVVDGELEFDGVKGDLWTKKSYEDFGLALEWRWEGPSQGPMQRPIIELDGSYRLDENGDQVTELVEERDSGIYLRGNSKSQVNLWEWPAGSGEVYGYRTDGSMPPATRAAATPQMKADHPVGEWNRLWIRLVGETLDVWLNDEHVIVACELPGVPESGPIGLQAHGSGIRFRNLYVRDSTPYDPTLDPAVIGAERRTSTPE
ncbi:MAG: DUF1080 domain-containing protein [Phycisphaerales bacterium]|nr:DUF1080 domain-containing protein [Phycisphaerales bacterium]